MNSGYYDESCTRTIVFTASRTIIGSYFHLPGSRSNDLSLFENAIYARASIGKNGVLKYTKPFAISLNLCNEIIDYNAIIQSTGKTQSN